jgi:hypothetical protein
MESSNTSSRGRSNDGSGGSSGGSSCGWMEHGDCKPKTEAAATHNKNTEGKTSEI